MTGAKDWTIDIETKGLPELRKIYAMYGAENNVMAKIPIRADKDEPFPHNYNQPSREVMYNFFNQHLKFGLLGRSASAVQPRAAEGAVGLR